ncbi:hypothetical protein PQX77_009436 [Marasmius sp. AFHP31]|nr:hypothetical protein PQX77_009436 [Marasmius sp. AFHP31]
MYLTLIDMFLNSFLKDVLNFVWLNSLQSLAPVVVEAEARVNKLQPRMKLTRTVTLVSKHARFHLGGGRKLFQRSFVTASRSLRSLEPSQSRVFTPRTIQQFSYLNRRYSTQNPQEELELELTSFPDPTRPDIFYHLVQTSDDALPAFAVSFLPTPPPSPESSTIIGWLPVGEGTGLNDFRENSKFRAVLHEAIQNGLKEDVDDVQRNGAIQQHSGWMHIHDDRNVPALGRIGDVDDIIASVLVEEGKILADTYQTMPAYRLVTADGVTQLTPRLAEKLKSVLTERARLEREGQD